MTQRDRLVVLPSLRGLMEPDGRVVVTEKFIDGMTQYARHWEGPVTAIVEPAAARSNNLDEMPVVPAELPFRLEVMSFDDPQISRRLSSAAVAMGGTDYRQNHLPALCRRLGVPYVVNTEYTLQTRLAIIAAEETNPLRRWRRRAWEKKQERANVRGIAQAAGIQCNGLPTFDAYRRLNENALLYFDTRVTADMVPDEQRIERRLATMLAGEPLRLTFSGRLIAMKGADHLPAFAVELRRLGVPFHLTICGAGDQEETIRRSLARFDLCGHVRLAGTLDFKTELLDRLRDETDLFVCPHRQGDPSCTYLETLACGVPIVGYDNEAWRGLQQISDAGWTLPLDDPAALACAVAQLHADRDELALLSLRAREFAARHTFEQTFAARIEHLRFCAGIDESVVA